MLLRQYVFFLLGRNQGVGFQALYEARLQKDYSQIELEKVTRFPQKVLHLLDTVGKAMADSKQQLKVYADFEGSNLDSY